MRGKKEGKIRFHEKTLRRIDKGIVNKNEKRGED